MATVVVYLAFGVVVTARSLIEVLAAPEYTEPVTTIDWIAVWSWSAAFALYAAAVLLLVRSTPAAGRAVRAIAFVAAAGAALAAIANVIEDAFDVVSWGSVYITGSVTTLLAGLVLAAALSIASRWREAAAAALWIVGIATVTFGLGPIALIGSLIAIDARRRTAVARHA